MPRSSGRALLLVLLALGILAVAYLLVGNPFDTTGGDAGHTATDGKPEDLRGGAPTAHDTEPATSSRPGLEGAYGAGDLGAVRLRLLTVSNAPVARQEVRLVARGGAEKAVPTADDGVALFPGLAPGRGYRVDVVGAGFAAVTIQGVGVAAGETTDLGDVILGANVVLAGRVVDKEGKGVPDAQVDVFRPDRSMALDGFLAAMVNMAISTPTPAESAKTDEEGRFALVNLPEGMYRLMARKSGYGTGYESEVAVAKDRPARALRIVLRDAAVAKGKVTDENGKAIAKARVVALRDMGRRFDPNGVVERETAKTDDDGKYVVDTLVRGTQYRFGVIADGFAPVFEIAGVEVQESLERDFTLFHGGSIAGTVKDKATGEPIVGAAVVALVGNLGFGGRGGGGGGSAPAERVASGTTRTDAEGKFLIENLVPGPVSMAQVRAAGYVSVAASAFTGGTWGDVTPGQTLDVSVTLERGGAVDGTMLDARTGAPIADAVVGMFPRDNPWQTMAAGTPSTTTNEEGRFHVEGVKPGKYGFFASARGYASPSPQDEALTVTVSDSGAPSTATLKLIAAGAAVGVVKDAKGEPVAGAKVRVRPAPPPQGQGFQGRGGAGGMGGMGNWRSFLPGAVTSDLTDQEGKFRVEGLAAGERWVVAAESEEYVPTDSQPFEVASGEEKEVEVVLQGGGAVHGRVVDDHGRFVAGARVRLGFLAPDQALRRNLNAWEMDRLLDPKTYFTDGDGRFSATGLRPGRTLVKVEKEGFVVFYKRDLEVHADETRENYVAALSRGEVVEGTVKSASGKALEGAMVAVTARKNPGPGDDEADATATDDSVEPQMSSRTDAEGRFRVENVMPGRTYSVVVWFAQGHQGWMGARSEKAIKREVAVPARDLEFALEGSTEEGPAFFGGGRTGGTGRPGVTPVAPPPPRPPGGR